MPGGRPQSGEGSEGSGRHCQGAPAGVRPGRRPFSLDSRSQARRDKRLIFGATATPAWRLTLLTVQRRLQRRLGGALQLIQQVRELPDTMQHPCFITNGSRTVMVMDTSPCHTHTCWVGGCACTCLCGLDGCCCQIPIMHWLFCHITWVEAVDITLMECSLVCNYP